jgi:uncharacterized damage-inducible protein DinB
MRRDEVALQFDYLYWIRDRILTQAAELSTDEFTAPETVTTRSLRATLVHELDVEWSWRERLRRKDFPEGELRPNDYPTCASVIEHWQRDEADMRGWIDGLTDDQLSLPPPGEEDTYPLWYYVVHITSHALQQFSEAAVLLTQAEHSPGEIGFLEFADTRRFTPLD